jgi:hypothetical protein
VLNKAKIAFSDYIALNYRDQLKGHRFNKIEISYSIIPASAVILDTMNIISILDKFFLDAITDVKSRGNDIGIKRLIPDDNYKIVTYGTIEVLDIDRTLEYYEAIIKIKGYVHDEN